MRCDNHVLVDKRLQLARLILRRLHWSPQRLLLLWLRQRLLALQQQQHVRPQREPAAVGQQQGRGHAPLHHKLLTAAAAAGAQAAQPVEQRGQRGEGVHRLALQRRRAGMRASELCLLLLSYSPCS